MTTARETSETVTAETVVPRHIAIIMDGNGRWAKARGLPRTMGHRKGVEIVRRTIRAAGKLGISYLTLYSFSIENWRRPLEEIEELMFLLRYYLRAELKDLQRNNVRFRVIGDRTMLPPDVLELILHSEKVTATNTGLTLVIALSYGARQEMVHAVQQIAEQVKSGQVQPTEISQELIEQCLYTRDIPDPDVILRTSGEQRLSNFLLWQSAYSEFVFLDKNWPDFTEQDLADAITEYTKRERRFGTAVS